MDQFIPKPLEFAICTVPAAPVRKEPAHRSEMVNQLLFGETMQVLESKDEWYRIRSTYDGYEGWLTHHLIDETSKAVTEKHSRFFAAGLVNPVMRKGQLMNVPMGSSLVSLNEESGVLWDDAYIYSGHYRNSAEPFTADVLLQAAHTWINAPYLWGGKTFMGVDCSGFAQTIFKLAGIVLKRDAYQQAEQGSPVTDLHEARQGDLAFFHNDKGRVTHVGLLLNNHEIIHAAGRVRVDAIDHRGIVHSEDGRRTHPLHSVRRYF